MSHASEKAWNTEDIRKFKQAFGARNSFSIFSSEPPHDPGKAYAEARQMLAKRKTDTESSVMALIGNTMDFGTNSLLEELMKRGQQLADETDKLLAVKPKDFDKATERLTLQTDAWVAFEARCVSAHNDMTAGEDDPGVRQKLADRAAGLSAMLKDLKKAAADSKSKVDFKQLDVEIGNLTKEAGPKGDAIFYPVAFGDRIEDCKAALQRLTNTIADSSKNPDELYRAEIKNLYNLDIEVAPKEQQLFGVKWSFPYKKFIDILAMVPPDHSMNKELQKVIYQKLEGAGADYSEYNKQIRIDPLVDYNFVGKYYMDPESKDWTLVDAFKTTTLHEIGHAVDAAYGIMNSHRKSKGCGGWQEADPIVYMMPQYKKFCSDMARSGVPDTPFQQHIGDAALRSLFASVAVGNKKPTEAPAGLEEFWQPIYDATIGKEFADRETQVGILVPQLGAAIATVLPANREAGDFETVRSSFAGQADVAKMLAGLTAGALPPVFALNDFWPLFRPLVEDPTKDTMDLRMWLFQQRAEYSVNVIPQLAAMRKQDSQTKVKLWVDTTMQYLPKPVDLTSYLAGAKPWRTDLSQAKIGEEAASHEAYKGNTCWWRYTAEDRKGTFVSDYQWRAPGEWFAELYAITWFKKVEPPGGVAKEVRQYLFGGHITPDKAV